MKPVADFIGPERQQGKQWQCKSTGGSLSVPAYFYGVGDAINANPRLLVRRKAALGIPGPLFCS